MWNRTAVRDWRRITSIVVAAGTVAASALGISSAQDNHHHHAGGGSGSSPTQPATPTPTTPTSAPTESTPAPTASTPTTPTPAPTTSAPTPTTPAAPAASGTTLPKGNVTSNGRTWVQSYAEDFTTAAAKGSVLQKYPQMAAYDGYKDTSGQGLYAPDKVLSVANGNLDFDLHSENGQPLVATILPDGYSAQTTGRVSVRYKTTKTPGYKFVGMMWPSSDNWNEGEIDWPEADLGGVPRPASAVPGTYSNGSMHFEPESEQFAPTDSTGYHVATTEWDKTAVRFYWDGKLVATTTKAVPTTPMRVTLQAETAIGEGTTPASSKGSVDIDWISIWK
ncbi:glycoside hydrolase family 16 protein [Curtobacterium pusillum]|uniref:glycoside hydrolase family 16 protein n=1 Tax=Curtobacterium pusillum TaxID=69373 RepID=UPI001643923E|nr:glycoside hydrolase family 16 protein [Curtobacterium pusillum]